MIHFISPNCYHSDTLLVWRLSRTRSPDKIAVLSRFLVIPGFLNTYKCIDRGCKGKAAPLRCMSQCCSMILKRCKIARGERPYGKGMKKCRVEKKTEREENIRVIGKSDWERGLMREGNKSWRARECMRRIRVDENGKDGSGKRKGHQSTPPDCLRCPRGKINLWGREGKMGRRTER